MTAPHGPSQQVGQPCLCGRSGMGSDFLKAAVHAVDDPDSQNQQLKTQTSCVSTCLYETVAFGSRSRSIQ